MAVRNILTYPNPLLVLRTREVTSTVDYQLILDMYDTLDAEPNGAALSANQVGINLRMFVVNRAICEQLGGERIFINPKITWHGEDKTRETEGCLSFPKILVEVNRWTELDIEYLNSSLKKKKMYVEGFHSRMFQHEIDHLDGKTFVDNYDFRKRQQISLMIKQGRSNA